MAAGYFGILALQGVFPLQTVAQPVGGYFGILGLQGVFPLQATPAAPQPAAGYFGLLDLQGLWVLAPGVAVVKVQEKKCNWGSWCRRNTRIVP